MLELLAVPFLACVVLAGIHAYLGLHVLARGVIFVEAAGNVRATAEWVAAQEPGHGLVDTDVPRDDRGGQHPTPGRRRSGLTPGSFHQPSRWRSFAGLSATAVPGSCSRVVESLRR